MHDATVTTDASLHARRALVVGVGGLGCPAAEALARSGVGTIGLIDPDVVEPSNLPRQLLYSDADIGRPKAEAAALALAFRTPEVRTRAFVQRLDVPDVELVREFDVVIDGTDTVATKFLVNDLAMAAGVPLVHAGAVGWQAQVLTVLPGATACYRCLFEEAPPADETPSCQDAGIIGPVVALAGALQAGDAVRVLRDQLPAFADQLLSVDLRAGTWRTVPLSRRSDCASCGRSEPS